MRIFESLQATIMAGYPRGRSKSFSNLLKAPRFYGVFIGGRVKMSRIFDNWPETDAFLKGKRNIKQTSFDTREEAEEFVRECEAACVSTLRGMRQPNGSRFGEEAAMEAHEDLEHRRTQLEVELADARMSKAAIFFTDASYQWREFAGVGLYCENTNQSLHWRCDHTNFTGNLGELVGVAEAFNYFSTRLDSSVNIIEIFVDSSYACETFMEQIPKYIARARSDGVWLTMQNKPVAHQDLLKKIWKDILALESQGIQWRIRHIPRALNTRADAASRGEADVVYSWKSSVLAALT